MAKMTKAERSRAASRRRRQKDADFQSGLADTGGAAVGAYASGRFGLAGRPFAGPLTLGAAIGLAGAASRLLLPAVDKNPMFSGLASGMVAVGTTELFVLGAAHRAASGG
jgi:hypothetical protein